MDLAFLAREIDLSISGDRRSGETSSAIGEAHLINSISGSGLITTKYAVVSAGVEIVSVHERRLHISPFPSLTPGYMLVRVLFAFKRNITDCAQAYRIDGSHATVSVCDKDQAVSDDWSWNRDVSTARKSPDFLSGRGIIAANVSVTIDYELRARAGLENRGSAPGRDVASRCAPDLAPIFETEGRDERVLLHVALNDDRVFVDERRAG